MTILLSTDRHMVIGDMTVYVGIVDLFSDLNPFVIHDCDTAQRQRGIVDMIDPAYSRLSYRPAVRLSRDA